MPEIYLTKPALKKGPEPPSFLHKLLSTLEAHHGDCAFNVEGLAGKMCLSRMQLHRNVKRCTRQSPGQFLLSFRLAKARQLLQHCDLRVCEVAYRAGFCSQGYFSRAFRSAYGITPKQARSHEGTDVTIVP